MDATHTPPTPMATPTATLPTHDSVSVSETLVLPSQGHQPQPTAAADDDDQHTSDHHHALLDLDPDTVDRLMLKSAYTCLQQAYAAAQTEHIRVDTLLVDAQQEARLLTLQVRALVDLILEKKPAFRRSNPNQRHQAAAPPPTPAPANGTSSSSSTTQIPPPASNSSALVQ